MKCAFYTLGCKVNQYESGAMAQELTRRGFTCVSPDEDADIYIINSCTVTAESDRKTRQAVRRFRRNHPDSIIITTIFVRRKKKVQIFYNIISYFILKN